MVVAVVGTYLFLSFISAVALYSACVVSAQSAPLRDGVEIAGD